MGRGVERVRELAGSLAREFGNETVVGLSSVEIVEVATALGGHELPSSYVEFLRLMGKVAGRMLVGTDIFYPRLLKVKEYAQELFEETGRVDLMSDTSIVFALHQGYQVYWFVDNSEDPQVLMYQEGDEAVSRRWDSFSSFLLDGARI